MQIIGDNGLAVTAAGAMGTVRIRNKYMASGYIEAPVATQRAFRDGWFHPGDIACWGPAGELVIAGRQDEIVNLGGVKVNLADVDEVLRSVQGIVMAASFRDPTEPNPPALMAMVKIANPAEAEKCVSAAHSVCRERFGRFVAPRAILVVPSIPLTGDGAPRRAECVRLAQALLARNVAARQM